MNNNTNSAKAQGNKKQFALGTLIHARNTGRKVEALFQRTRLDQRDQRIIAGIECTVNGLPVYLPCAEFVAGETVDTFRAKKTLEVCVTQVNFKFAVVSQKVAAARDAFEATLKPETDEQFRELKVISEQPANAEKKQSHRFWVALEFGIKAALYDEGISAGAEVKVKGTVRVRIRSAKDGRVSVTMLSVEDEKKRVQASRPESRRHNGSNNRTAINTGSNNRDGNGEGAKSHGATQTNRSGAGGQRNWTNGEAAKAETKEFKSRRRGLADGRSNHNGSRAPFGRDRRFKAPKANESTDWRKDLATYHSKVDAEGGNAFAALGAISGK